MSDLIQARSVIVLADCHIHPGQGIAWPEAALRAFAGAELFVTLGDMGERSGLDALARIAPVLGVAGADDEADPRTAAKARVLEAPGLRIGCVFDPAAAGLVAQREPPLSVAPEALAALFGGPVDVLLWASTHAPALDRSDGLLKVNPGSATLPADGVRPSFARLRLEGGRAEAEIVSL